jgi:hypothetical protein
VLFVDAVDRRSASLAVKWARSVNEYAAKDRGAELRELLARRKPLAAFLTLALVGADALPGLAPELVRELRNYAGIWRN